MKRVTGFGGIFFKSDNPEQVREWYYRHLGIQMDSYGAIFEWRHADMPEKKGFTVFSPFKSETTYFDPSGKPFMFNFLVQDLDAVLQLLREEGVTVVGEVEELEYGKFGWILDPEGNKIELFQPNEA